MEVISLKVGSLLFPIKPRPSWKAKRQARRAAREKPELERAKYQAALRRCETSKVIVMGWDFQNHYQPGPASLDLKYFVANARFHKDGSIQRKGR